MLVYLDSEREREREREGDRERDTHTRSYIDGICMEMNNMQKSISE